MATAGCDVYDQGKPMLLTVNHFLEDLRPAISTESDEASNEDSDFEMTGLSDFEHDTDFTKATSDGSISDTSVDESFERDASVLSNESVVIESFHQNPEDSDLSAREESWYSAATSKRPCIVAGKTLLRSRELDYAFIEIDSGFTGANAPCANALSLDGTSGIESNPRDAIVWTATPDGGVALFAEPYRASLIMSVLLAQRHSSKCTRPIASALLSLATLGAGLETG